MNPEPYRAMTWSGLRPFGIIHDEMFPDEVRPTLVQQVLAAIDERSNNERPYILAASPYHPPGPQWTVGLLWTWLDWGLGISAHRELGAPRRWPHQVSVGIEVGPFYLYVDCTWGDGQ